MVKNINQDDIEAGIKRKGFRRSNTDHRKYILYFNGKKEGASTHLSHGKNEDIGAGLLKLMAKELGISTQEFLDLVSCSLSAEDYLAKQKANLATKKTKILKHG